MKQIYDFERVEPPVLNQNMLKRKEKAKRQNGAVILAVVAGILLQIAMLLFGWTALEWYPSISALCFGYTAISLTGGGIVAIIYSKKEGTGTWLQRRE